MGASGAGVDKPIVQVLVIDDNELIFHALSEMLQRATTVVQYQARWARDHEEGLRELMMGDVQACLLDYHLDETRTGVDVLRAIDALELHVPVVVLTASSTAEKDAECMEYGAVDFLDKSAMTPSLLDRAIRYGMERKRVELELLNTQAEVSRQNLSLAASLRRLEDAQAANKHLLAKLKTIEEHRLLPLQELMNEIIRGPQEQVAPRFPEVQHAIQDIAFALKPLLAQEAAYQDIRSKRVLLAETDRKVQLLARMALRGSGAKLDTATTLSEGEALISRRHYDIVFVNKDLIELASTAHAYDPGCKIVFLTTERPSEYVEVIREYPFLANIVSRPVDNRNLTLKNILTTVSKLATEDYFGLEKYLGWGVEVKEHAIESSSARRRLVDEMEEDFRAIGVRPSFVRSAVLIAEELLMNAIYDAPVDEGGNPLYNHLPRTEEVKLPVKQQGRFRYACDGTFLAVSCEDPFGMLKQSTILDYLSSCYSGQAGTLQQHKGGAGQGLFQIIETSTVLAINVEPGKRTEVIAIVAIDPELRAKGKMKAGSLHYFSAVKKQKSAA